MRNIKRIQPKSGSLTLLQAALQQSPYQSYSYSYPHKSAYAELPQAMKLDQVWREENRSSLFCYIHIPFCEFRCGFCNLFTLSLPPTELQQHYVNALIRQMRVNRTLLDDLRFARFSMGGGTPSYLSTAALETILSRAVSELGIDFKHTPACIEISPHTATLEKLQLFKSFDIDRISMGVQSFNEGENKSLCRPQRSDTVLKTVELIRQLNFPTLNLDLIYGIEGQTIDSWMQSVAKAVELQVEELYLYPLYVRPLTGLNKIEQKRGSLSAAVDIRYQMYRQARDYLLASGYRQISMRMFRATHTAAEVGPVYSCQDDGMLGLGSGARSYTRGLHYSGKYGISRKISRSIIEDYCGSDDGEFSTVSYGVALNQEEQRRRYIIQSLLLVEGLDKAAYQQRFFAPVLNDFPQLRQLLELGLAQESPQRLSLTEAGIARADTIGPWLVSDHVQRRMQDFQLQ